MQTNILQKLFHNLEILILKKVCIPEIKCYTLVFLSSLTTLNGDYASPTHKQKYEILFGHTDIAVLRYFFCLIDSIKKK